MTCIADTPEDVFSKVEGENIDIKWPRHAELGTFGFELLDGLPHPVTGYDFMVNKGGSPKMRTTSSDCYQGRDFQQCL